MLEVRDTMLLLQRKTCRNSVVGPDSSSGHQEGLRGSLGPASTVTVWKGWPSCGWAFLPEVHWNWTKNPRESG